MVLRDLFPPIEPYVSGFLKVDDIHTLYWEESGNPNGIPIVFVHGGPGAGCTPRQRSYFDPSAWRILIFDQRGCGRSSPRFETRQNTRMLLVSDMEKLRQARAIERWHLFGGSWGSTLALSYATMHPDRCLGLILRSIFLLSQEEVDWFTDGIPNFFPEAGQALAQAVGLKDGQNLFDLCYAQMRDQDPLVRERAMLAWHRYEASCSCLIPQMPWQTEAQPIALIETHFLKNEVIPEPQSLLRAIPRIRHLPGAIVQGRYDCICPIKTADALHRAWPEASYQIIPDAGHSLLEPGIRSALIDATERFKTIKDERP